MSIVDHAAKRRTLVIAVTLLSLASSLPALAQTTPAPTAPPATTAPTTTAPTATAPTTTAPSATTTPTKPTTVARRRPRLQHPYVAPTPSGGGAEAGGGAR